MSQYSANEIVPETARQAKPGLALAFHQAIKSPPGTIKGDTAMAVLINAIGRAHPLDAQVIPAAMYAVRATAPDSLAEKEATMRFGKVVQVFGERQAAQHRQVAAEWLGNAFEVAKEMHGAESSEANALHLKLARNVFGAQSQALRS